MEEQELYENVCKPRFTALEEKIKERADAVEQYGKDIVKLFERVDTLTKSMSNLTKALWGLAISIIMLLFSTMANKIFI